MAKKSCKKGYYYCNTDKKCKKVPKGWHVMPSTGYLMRDSEHKEEEKNGNGDGTNGNGGSNGGSDGGGVSESKDHEVAMAQSQLKKSEENIRKLRRALGKKEKDIPAWMQAKITDTAHDTDAAAGYVDKMDEEVIAEKRDGKSAKDKGYSLHDWFRGGGWKQAGGKYDGKPCARQPGQKTKPFCRDADDRANMSKKERERRAKKKRREDPNPNRRGPAKMVSASYSNWRSDLEQLDEFMGLFGPKTVTPKDSPTGTKSVNVGKKYPARQNGRPVDVTYDKQGNKTVTPMPRGRAGLMQYKYGSTWGMPQYNSYEPEGEVVEGYPDEGEKIGPTHRIKMGDGKLRTLKDIDAKLKDNKPVQKNSYEPEGEIVDEGKKDACYHKVKSRYSVWPSAYASGALVKCRKVGAKNWGNKTKKESYEFSNWRDDFQATEYESVDVIKPEPLQATDGIGSQMLDEKKRLMNKLDKISGQLRKASAMHKKQSQEVAKVSQHLCAKEVKHEEFGYGETIFGEHAIPDENGFVSHYNVQFEHGIVENVSVEDMKVLTLTEHENHEMDGDVIFEGGKKCWKGYKKAGTQKLFGKTYNRCVKAHFSDWRADMNLQEKESKPDYLDFDGDGNKEESMKKALKDKKNVKKEEFELQEAIPGYDKYDAEMKRIRSKGLKGLELVRALKAATALRPPTEKEVNQKLGEDWQKSNRKDGVDGMSQKSVNAYKRENPGSKLQTAVTEKKPTGKRAKRRTSFCARSKGQKDMHNIDCTKTPDKKICKARKRWRC